MSAPVEQRLDMRPLPNVKRACSLWRVNLVPGDREGVAPNLLHIDGNFPRRLHRVGVEVDVSLRRDLPNLLHRLEHARLVVRHYDCD